jgi:hypothetical protein
MQLLNLFTVAGMAGDLFRTDWVPFPEDYDQLEFRVECKMFEGGEVLFDLQSGMDLDENAATSLTTTSVNVTGPKVTAVTSGIGAYMRLEISIQVAASRGVFSVWALPKRS